MKKTKEAIMYGIETLHISADKIFSLIESSRGYDGEDYSRWLASKIIEVAEGEGIGFSQLLVKKFSIVQSLSEGYSFKIRDIWKGLFERYLEGKDCYSFGLDYIGTPVEEEIDWMEGVDYDPLNSDFVMKSLPESIREGFLEDRGISWIFNLSNDAISKKSSIFREAKRWGIKLNSYSAGLLYRMCMVISSFEDCVENFSFAFLCKTDFLLDSENADIISHLLSYFRYDGFTIKSYDLFEESFTDEEYAFIVCKPRGMSDAIQDGFILKRVYLSDNKIAYKSKPKRYSRSFVGMLDYLENRTVLSKEKTYGYLNIEGYNSYLSYEEGKRAIKITNANIKDVIIYYSVVKSLGMFGLPIDITCVLSGSGSYEELFSNCIPLFLYDEGSMFKGTGVFERDSELVKKLLSVGEVNFSPEAKELIDVCKGFEDYIDNGGSLTFKELREEVNHGELNRSYLSALVNLKDYISTLYRKMR